MILVRINMSNVLILVVHIRSEHLIWCFWDILERNLHAILNHLLLLLY